MSARLTIQPRCPVCTAPTEGWRCGLGCEISRRQDCGELVATTEDHDCAATCDDCGDPIEDGTGCHHDGDYCAACFLNHCRECARDLADDMRAESRIQRWRDGR